MEEQKNIIDLRVVFGKAWSRRRLFYKVWCVTLILSVAWIFPQPRIYDTSVMLAPETNGELSGGSLGSLASSFGINIGSMVNNDAIYPLLYPDVISSNDFIVGLLGIPVKTIDGSVETDYLTYLVKHQKRCFWDYPGIWLKKLLENFNSEDERRPIGVSGQVDPYHLSLKEERLVKALRSTVKCAVDKKTDVITISVSDQDPLVCATICDSVRTRLQNFIISYRTSKARNDVEYYSRMAAETYQDYLQAVAAFGTFADTHRGSILQTTQSRRDELENEVQMKFNTYNIINTQLDAAKAKVQERTPAFTVLQNASIPAKPSSPKRMIFVLAMLVLTTMCTVLYVIRYDKQAATDPVPEEQNPLC